MQKLFADEVLIAILYFLPENKRKFKADREILHNALFDFKSDYPKIFSEIQFRQRYLFYESLSLDQALSNLEATGLLERRNESPKLYYVSDELKKAFKTFVSKRLKECKFNNNLFEEIAGKFIRRCA